MSDGLIFKFFERYVGDIPNEVERLQWERRCSRNDFDSWFVVDERSLSGPRKPTILVWTSCHSMQMNHYLRHYRKDFLDDFHVNYILINQLMLDPSESINRMTRGLIAHADLMWDNNFADKFGPFSNSQMLVSAKPELRRWSFVPPTCACWWPISYPFGEDGVVYHMKQGMNANGIIDQFRRGTFNPCFPQRYATQMANLQLREKRHDVIISDFVQQHFHEVKCWSSFNHPTYHLIALIVERLIAKMNVTTLGAISMAMSVPTNAANMGHAYPETDLEWNYYEFQYPQRYTTDRGGASVWYPDQIRQSYAKQRALLDRGEKDYVNPEDDL